MEGSPTPYVYLNGRILPRDQAHLDIEDRGAMFADGVYEVIRYYRGRPFALDRHERRLRQSLAALRLEAPAALAALPGATAELLTRCGLTEASVYWQITRGVAPREHAIPSGLHPTVLAIAYPVPAVDPAAPPPSVSAILLPDERWHHCAIKTLMLLPNVLAKTAAHDAGAHEAILYRGRTVTEGSSTNVAIVTSDGVLRTHRADQWILPGVTRAIVLELAKELGIKIAQRAFNPEDLFTAAEVFITGSTTQMAAVTALDGKPVGGGRLGPVTQRLYQAFLARVASECGPW
jgi:D-alanine transaminase